MTFRIYCMLSTILFLSIDSQSPCYQQQLRIIFEVAKYDDAGTTDTVFVRFFDKDEFVQPFNKQNSSRSLKPLQNYSADFVFDHMNTSGPWGLDKFAVGPGSIPGGKNFDNLKLKNIWIQDGKITRVYDCDCRVGQNSDRSWVYPDYIKSFTEINVWPKNCPGQSHSVIGIEDKCYEYVKEAELFNVARELCMERPGYKGRLIDPATSKENIGRIMKHFHLSNETFLWLGFGKVDLKLGKLKIINGWVDMQTFQPFSMEKNGWKTGQPTNRSNEMCGCAKTEDMGLLHDCYCSYKAVVICENSAYIHS
ncbi:uncharacterized protein LOC142348487 [Convolutriloba macropyga]|uniref:uncharacterized protein LOC142348487 n=1 Tax=Convolutriloba macropyga TaxID=536237 RepID=UPI003F52278D